MVVIAGGSLAPDVHATPFDTAHVREAVSLYTPVWSTADHIFIAQPVTVAGTQQSRVARLDKSYVTQQDVQLAAAAHDSNPGHRGASVAVLDDGTVLASPDGHNVAWSVRKSTAANDLSTLAATADPTGGDSLAYRRFFRGPTGALYLAYRDTNTYTTHLYRWDGAAWQPWASPLTQQGALGGAYGCDLAFGVDGTIYTQVEWVPGNTGSGYPRAEAAVIRTTDDGATWTDMTGAAVTLPLQRGAVSPVLPDESVVSRVAIGANDRPVLLASHRDYRRSVRDLWVARWNGTAWGTEELVPHTVGANIGNLSVAHHGDVIVGCHSRFDANDDAGWPSGTYQRPGPLSLLASTDGGLSWTTYTLDDGTATPNYWGGYVDPHSLRLDGIVRLLPLSMDVSSKSELWEVALP